jgi:hypothetical protein
MDVTNVSRSEIPTLQGRDPTSGSNQSTAAPPEPAAAKPAAASAPKADATPHSNPAIALDTDTNATVLKYQEASGNMSFQLPSKTTLEYQRHQAMATHKDDAAGAAKAV